MEEITSRSNARVKAAAQLLSSAAARREEGFSYWREPGYAWMRGKQAYRCVSFFLTRQALERYPKETAFFEGKSRFRFFDYRGN